MATDRTGNIYFGSLVRSTVYRIGNDGSLGLVAGQNLEFAGTGFSGDGGPGSKARLDLTYGGLAVDSTGSVYIADNYNTRIRKVTPDGIINTVAGNGRFRQAENLPATSTALYLPMAIAFDPSGSLYIAEAFLNRIRKISAGGVATNFAGNGEAGFAGDNGPPPAHPSSGRTAWRLTGTATCTSPTPSTAACVPAPAAPSTFAGGGLPPPTASRQRVATSATLSGRNAWRWTPQATSISPNTTATASAVVLGGTITTIAALGRAATLAIPDWPCAPPSTTQRYGVRLRRNLYFADSSNNVVRRISTGGTITTVAATATPLQRQRSGRQSHLKGPWAWRLISGQPLHRRLQ